ncbi:hypothetical protein PG999_000252 [Apiospora kogelbergensis]|uniref:MARVEL domain-containing protein n=1 Tax=Apiospora kogelbergensis TaxID=1337665 RepID=A0AAW0RBE6_9PEZI
MGAISGVLARVLHALLVVLSIGLIAVFSVASNPSDKNGSESRAMTRVQLFAYNIILAIFSFVWFCLLLVLSFTRLWRHAPLPRVVVAALSVVVSTLLFLQTASVLSNAVRYYTLLKEAEDEFYYSRRKSSSSSSSSWCTSSGGSYNSSSRTCYLESSKPYLAVIVVTGLFNLFLLCDLVVSFVRMLSSAHEVAPVQKHPDGHATSQA